ncbi:small conductance mechanosensitive channel [Microbacterium resistens]|uniref:Small conductance mechanosensitive channel n=1 Tax=Microbacterium resistens TaxID=156977 RepID=A0ABU1S917_9MICO|nr:mechanosensitive ion channel domain-containing protein [Microbacterium resistens]MDR6866070.1 small conductance mechanosensitive channel [Microbacterium resistens]
MHILPIEETPPPVEPPVVATPDLWTQILTFLGEAGMNLLYCVAVVAGAVAIAALLRLLIRRVVHRIVDGAKSRARVDDTQALERSPLADMRLVQRTRTLGTILQNIVNVILGIVGIVLIINTLAPSLLGSLTLLTAAIGAGLGFGAQNIVKDVLNGIFIVAEDQVGIGDVVDLGLATGVVEYVSVRITQVRDVNGTLWYVRNGEVTRIGNMSQGWARAIVDLGVPPDADVPAVEESLLAAAQALAKDPKWRTRIVEKPEVWGLETVTGEALVIRVVIKTRANAMDDVARELRMRLRAAIGELGLSVPSLNSVTLTGPEGARRVRGANPPRTRPTAVTGVPTVAERGFWRRRKSDGTTTPVTPPTTAKPAKPAGAPRTTGTPKPPTTPPQPQTPSSEDGPEQEKP